tara:strand:- start:489 stop:632 length:144 start_codon:yes stop_codon:yes gene_type:complete
MVNYANKKKKIKNTTGKNGWWRGVYMVCVVGRARGMLRKGIEPLTDG